MNQPPPPHPVQAPNLILTIIQTGSLGMSLLPTTVLVNGMRLPAQVGDNPYVVPPGPLHIEAWGQWTFGLMGHATWQQMMHPGEQVHLYWSVPAVAWMKQGVISPTPQRSRGFVGLMVGLAVIVAVIFALILLIALLSAGSS